MDDSESNFLTWPGEPNTHAWESTTRFAHTTFPLSFQSVDPGHLPRLHSPTTLHPYVATKINPTSTRRVNDHSPCCSNQVLKLPDYPISRHVSTFKSLTKCATHRDLSQFQLFRRGITTTQPRPLSLYFNSK